MEFFTVGTSKLKIILSKEEAEARGISADSAGDEPEKRKSFRRILEEAKERADFDAAHEKVLIQIYPTSSGGMELFITKLGILSKEATGIISRSERAKVLSTRRVYYVFSRFEDLIRAVKCIPQGSAEDSEAYLLDGGGYCLSFCEREGAKGLSFTSRLLEFGRKLNTGPLFSLEEHATPLAVGDAVERLSRL